MYFGLVIASTIFVADQASKYIIIEWIMRPEGVTVTPFFSTVVVEVFPILNLRMAWNSGISFSLFDWNNVLVTIFLIGVQIGITSWLVWWLGKLRDNWLRAAVGLIIGGACGNILDRMRYGAVADFVDVHIAGFHWPTFNLADAAICIGVIMWLIDAFILQTQHTNDKTIMKDG